jgi:hypothetical protein
MSFFCEKVTITKVVSFTDYMIDCVSDCVTPPNSPSYDKRVLVCPGAPLRKPKHYLREAIDDVVRDTNYCVDTDLILQKIKAVYDGPDYAVPRSLIRKFIEKYYTGMMWRCVECRADLGTDDSRQLCCKTYCGGN